MYAVWCFIVSEMRNTNGISHCCCTTESKRLQVCASKPQKMHLSFIPLNLALTPLRSPSSSVASSFPFLLQKPSQENDVTLYSLIKTLKLIAKNNSGTILMCEKSLLSPQNTAQIATTQIHENCWSFSSRNKR